VINVLSAGSVVFAALAAILWAWSSVINLPVLGSGWGTLVNTEEFYAAMKKIGRLNMTAAACAFISTLCQAIVLYLSSH
jgi:hypothetical protein